MFIEHVNLTVSNARRSADFYEKLFDWRTRWEGPAIHDGYSIHVGDETSYLALYQRSGPERGAWKQDTGEASLNHVGIVVDDLDSLEKRLHTAGIKTFNHADYEPGRRFYFYDLDGIEIEIVAYAKDVLAAAKN